MQRLIRVTPLLLLALFACSKSSTSTTASSSPAATETASAMPASSASCKSLSGLSPLTDKGVKAFTTSTVALNADNDNGLYYYEPTCVKAKGTLSVTIKNVGDVLHNFSITSLGISKDIEMGKSVTVSVQLPSSGTLPFFCKYHKTSGMQGAFISQ